MNRELSVLQKFTVDHYHADPYPHVIIEQALPDDLYQRLAAEYPESILGEHTTGFKDFRYYQHEFSPEHITPLWQRFIDFHASCGYKDQVIRALEPGMQKYYPDIVDKYLKSDVSARHSGKPRGTAAMEVQFVMNSADTTKIRSAHLDQGRELFACLFYMRKPEDTSTGGDLCIYRKSKTDFHFLSGRIAPPEDIEEVTRVPYRANTLVIFLNTADSIHGVSTRTDAPVFRRYVNIDCHVAEKLFRLD